MLSSLHGVPFAILWLAWLGYWFVAALNVKRTERRERFGSLILNRAPLAIGACLLAFERQPFFWLSARFLPLSQVFYWIGLFMLAAGLGFAVWARRCLGRNWSGIVTVKQDHELIRSGPYALVRHPIYTGSTARDPRYCNRHRGMARSYRLRFDYCRICAEASD